VAQEFGRDAAAEEDSSGGHRFQRHV
jgi:hypothetical protein